MTNESFKKVMAYISEKSGRQITPMMAKGYWHNLKQFSDKQVENAVMEYYADPDVCQFFPQEGMIIAKINGTTKQQQTALIDRAQEQWILVQEKMRRQGAYGTVKFDDKVTMKSIQLLGGWRDLCHTPTDKIEWRRKEFIECYRNSVNADHLPDSLAGIGSKSQHKLESQNQLKRIDQGVKNVGH